MSKVIYKLAKGYVFLALLLSASVWLFYFAGIQNDVILKILSLVMSGGGMLGHLTLGYLIGNILFTLRSGDDPEASYQVKKIIRLTLWGISILVSNTFLITIAGKSQHLGEMTSFFNTSGYAIWFLYFIMAAEAFGGLGILLHFKLKTGPLAAAVLMLIMLGAVYTHWHNKDPFSDSYAAVSQFVNLSLMFIIYYFEGQVKHKVPVSSIYVV